MFPFNKDSFLAYYYIVNIAIVIFEAYIRHFEVLYKLIIFIVKFVFLC